MVLLISIVSLFNPQYSARNEPSSLSHIAKKLSSYNNSLLASIASFLLSLSASSSTCSTVSTNHSRTLLLITFIFIFSFYFNFYDIINVHTFMRGAQLSAFFIIKTLHRNQCHTLLH